MIPALTVRLEQGQPRREKLSQGGTPPSIPVLPEDGEGGSNPLRGHQGYAKQAGTGPVPGPARWADPEGADKATRDGGMGH